MPYRYFGKRFLFVAALALQSLVVVVLWTRLFDANASRPSWQMAMIRWSLPAVWVASIVLWQFVFGKRRWIGMSLTTIAACVYTLTHWCGRGGRVLLRVPEEFFHALGLADEI